MNDAVSDTIAKTQKLASIFDSVNSEMIIGLFVGLLTLFIIARVISWALLYLAIKLPFYRLSILQLNTIITHMIYIIGTIWLLYVTLNPSQEMIYAFLGSGAVAIGFSLKDLVSSIIAGIILIFDRPFQVGDRILFRDNYGDIIQIGLRSVRIQTLDDSTVTIPNNLFLSENVASANSGQRDMMVCSFFYFKNNCDIARMISLLEEVTTTSRYAYLKKPLKVIVSTEKFEHGIGIKATVKAYVLETIYEKAFETDITKRFYEALKEEELVDQLLSES
ncbi:transporter, small conductance mechanosensitive ion channel MscS family protein [Bacteriovorax sp. BAL6_X]|uniref:mechanosensitive ion channel family protein n=1 Tax=Bacteriovorax sp. BAL6_X TaxID=1201290 RepID=UPI0003854631|nr:mechanosensitive ion channel domain-containing protein [Bacteriovorax sp. BAL6_X]EPZ49447.1 transporter, small conductance mechanosensitive ion channel MscS family protein [Bacteriovorax sp. BAL6_X]